MEEVVDINVSVEAIADGAVVRPVGAIDRGNVPSLREQVGAVQRQRPARLILDLSEVPSIDSAAVAALVDMLRVARCGSTLLVLCGLQERVRALLRIVRLADTVFTIVGAVDEAVALPNRRKFGRFVPGDLRCDLGQVLDVSASGMRVLVKRKPRGVVTLEFEQGRAVVSLTAEVVWTHRIRFRQYEAGLRFVGLDADAARRLASIVGEASEQSKRLRRRGRSPSPPRAA